MAARPARLASAARDCAAAVRPGDNRDADQHGDDGDAALVGIAAHAIVSHLHLQVTLGGNWLR